MFPSSSPQSSRFRLFHTFGVFFLLLASGNAAEVRCELVRDSCLDLSNATNPTITVPSNTTRIDKNGLDICIPILVDSNAVDLIFAIDQSGSMDNMDPEFLTPAATREALDLLNQVAPQSRVGYFGFGNGLCDGTGDHIGHNAAGPRNANPPNTAVPPAPLNQGTQLAQIREQMSYDATNYAYSCGKDNPGGTNYFTALELATDWLKQLDTPNPKLIFFLTDGLQNIQESDFDALVAASDSTNYPVVHAIFVGEGTNLPLETLVEKTGGIYNQIADFANLKTVMLAMMGKIVVKNRPTTTTLTKNVNSVWQTSTYTQTGDFNRFKVNLDQDVALDMGLNAFSVVSGTNMGQQQSAFNIQVSGAAETTTGKKELPGSNLFDLVCYDASALIPMDKNYINAIQQLAYLETGFGVTLVTPANDITAVTNIRGVGDTEKIKLNSSASGYRGIAAFSHMTLKTPNNGIAEGLGGETLLLSWVHPHDPRDTASALLPIFNNTKVNFTDMRGNELLKASSLAGNQFKVVITGNKAVGPFSIQLASPRKDIFNVSVHIHNLQGKRVISRQGKGANRYNFSAVLAPGVYFVKVRTDSMLRKQDGYDRHP